MVGPAAQELRTVDQKLAVLNERRSVLLAHLYSVAPNAGPAVWPNAWSMGWPNAGPMGWAPRPPRADGQTDVSRMGVRNALLSLGGVLLGIAAMVFTVISWGSLSLGGRALVLATLTGVALWSVWPLAKRGLTATAETIAVVGLLLIGLECYAAYAGNLFGLHSADPVRYAAIASLGVTLYWAGYATIAPVRLAMPQAILVGQLILPLWAVSADAGTMGMAMTLLTLALADLLIRVLAKSSRTRGTASFTGLPAWVMGGLLGLGMAVTESSVESGVVLAVAAAVAMVWAVFAERRLAVGAGLLLPLGIAAALPMGHRWVAAGIAVAAIAVVGAARVLPVRVRRATEIGGLAALGVAVLGVVIGTTLTLIGPLRQDVWSGAPAVLPADMRFWMLPAAPVVLAIVAVVLALGRRTDAAPVLALAVLTIPGVPYEARPAMLVGLAALLAAWALVDRVVGITAVAVAAWTVAASLAIEQTTLATLSVVTVLAVGFAVAPALRPWAAATATAALGGTAAAYGLAYGLPVQWAAFGVLAAAGIGLAVAAWLRALPVEVVASAVGAVGIGMAVVDPLALSLALSFGGVLAFAVSLRRDRRQATWAGSMLMLAAWWVRLADTHVTSPEAYTLPVSVALLTMGWMRRRQDSGVSSWIAYGPGLASTLLPSLLVSWHEPAGLRALLLGAAALAIALIGAKARLQAPLLLGGAVLVADAARQLAPYVAEASGQLPGWVPIAAAGLALLVIGATYEHRLRDLRRLRHAVERLG
ncbi:hypothetical protein J4573_38040 [Actinomadura barringtoniae]|uniref:DUF2157 domain-containing protein n=1 Tax=Actinomadura barringtoniae TaxID=1427535 RepID=A0A939PPQ7_9ACTN|nr:hypothetical protein [Actinomadura barringtoniae]MBO2452944.1 hypothetical protein [Actinomadura barringtoniae]